MHGEYAVTTRADEDIVIRVRSDVYERACENHGRDRFALAHELGHYSLHRHFLDGNSEDTAVNGGDV